VEGGNFRVSGGKVETLVLTKGLRGQKFCADFRYWDKKSGAGIVALGKKKKALKGSSGLTKRQSTPTPCAPLI